MILITTTFTSFSSKIGECLVVMKIYLFIYRKTTTKISEVKSDSFSRSSLGFRLRRGFGLALSWGGGRLSFRFVL